MQPGAQDENEIETRNFIAEVDRLMELDRPPVVKLVKAPPSNGGDSAGSNPAGRTKR
jgi:hypothetical protein